MNEPDPERGARITDERHRASIAPLEAKLAASEAARREAEERCDVFTAALAEVDRG